jgi:hypothetical protein
VKREPVATSRFGFAASYIRVGYEVIVVELVGVNHCNADAAVHVENVLFLYMGDFSKVFEYRFREGLRACSCDIRHQYGEFVAAETTDGAAAAHAALKLICNFSDHAVTGRVAAGVVDVLELIEVDEQQGRFVVEPGYVLDLLAQFLHEAPAVVEPSEHIMIRKS